MATTNAEKIPTTLYPTIKVERIINPSRFYAVPLIGGFVKIIMLIPVAIDLFAISIAVGVMLFINSFVVLFTGNYWKPSYELTLGLMRLSLKISYFWRGLTNKYPGFDLGIHDNYSLDIAMPEKPNRFFAIPIVGGSARFILLIPYFIYTSVIQNAANIAAVGGSFAVLFNGYYPETTFELNRDCVRLSQTTTAYISGFSDSYPNFWISMNHKNMKIFLIVLGALWTLFGNFSRFTHPFNAYQRNNYYPNTYRNNYYNNQNNYRYPTPSVSHTFPTSPTQNTY